MELFLAFTLVIVIGAVAYFFKRRFQTRVQFKKKAAAVSDSSIVERIPTLVGSRERPLLTSGITTKLSALLDLDEVCKKITQHVVPSFSDWCTIDLLLDKEQILNIEAEYDSSVVKKEFQLKKSISILSLDSFRGQVFQNKKPRLVESFSSFKMISGFPALPFKVRSSIQNPLCVREKMIGSITFFRSYSSKAFDAEDLVVTEAFATEAAVAIDNARIYQEAKQAIEKRDEFLSIASHELKTPLTSLNLIVHLLSKLIYKQPTDGTVFEEIKDKLDVADRQIRRLTRLIDNLLDISRIRNRQLSMEFEPTDFSNIVLDVTYRFQEDAKNASCKLSVHTNGPIIGIWDKVRLEQVITNLVSNAIKYGRNHPVEVYAYSELGMACLKVQDYGKGISSADQKRIFYRFERADNNRNIGGLGLGLYIVKQIVDGHGGTISVESYPNKGSTFVVKLPKNHEAI